VESTGTFFIMEQLGINFTAPISGRTARSRHASWTGSRHVSRSLGERVSAVKQLLQNHGPITDHDIAALVPCSLSSVNSCRACLVRQGYRIIEVDFEEVQWASGTTKRARRQLINPVLSDGIR
jgi:hypothetical protein